MPPTLTLHLLFLISIIVTFPPITLSDIPCAYPCYPPPTGSGSGSGSQQTPATLTPPYAQSGSAYPPPGYYPTPTSENLPNNPSQSDGNNNNNPYGAPPPPDPILPYFPFYYRKPPHQTDQSPSSSAPAAAEFLGKSTIAILVSNLVLAFIFQFLPFV